MKTSLRSAHFASDRLLEECLSGLVALHAGMTGGSVAKVQQALMEMGYVLRDFGPDGVFGHETARAVAKFNTDIGIDAEAGELGSQAMAALDDRFVVETSSPAVYDRAAGAVQTPLKPSASPSAKATATAAEYAMLAVDLALAQAARGSHYLVGAAGAEPGGSGGTHLRPAGVKLAPTRTDPVDPAVFAAQCDVLGLHVCAGRFNAPNGGIAGGRPFRSSDTDLIVYLAGLAARPEASWMPFFQFFSPRRVDAGLLRPELVWGEDCRTKQHFDGVGLVNWCLENAVGGRYPISFDIGTWATEASGTDPVVLTELPRKGDIVMRLVDDRFTHIGFLIGDHDPADARNHGHVVLAEQASVGVVRRRFSPSGWTARRRPTPALLHD